MKQYHKINTVFKRDPANMKHLLVGQWSEEVFEYLAENEWVFTEKVDGTNIRVMITDEITFGGKTDNASIPSLLVTRLQERFLSQREQLLEMFPNGACLYGEGYGAKIQKIGSSYRSDQDFVLFDVKIGEWWLKHEDVRSIAERLDLEVVPIVGIGTLYDAIDLVSRGIESTWGSFPAEGIVARPSLELKTRNDSRVITKVKTCDFRSE